MWKETPPCRTQAYCPLNWTGSEHMIYLVFDYHAGGEQLAYENMRVMPFETAQQILAAEAKRAQILQKRAMKVALRGGDPFARFEALKEICEWAWSGACAVPVRFQFTITQIDQQSEALRWTDEHAKQLNIFWRRSAVTTEDCRMAAAHKLYVRYEYSPDNAERAREELALMVAQKISFTLNPVTPENWSRQQQDVYKSLLDQFRTISKTTPWEQEDLWLIRQAHFPKLAPGNGCCYDTTGYAWPCPQLSPLALRLWSMEGSRISECLNNEKTQGPLSWLCPGQQITNGAAGIERIRRIRRMERECGLVSLMPKSPLMVRKSILSLAKNDVSNQKENKT